MSSESFPNLDTLLVAVTEIEYSIILEYAGLSIEGRVHSASLEGYDRSYNVGSCNKDISFNTTEPEARILEENELVDLQRLMLGLARLKANVSVKATLISKMPTQKFIESIPNDSLISDLSQTIHSDSNLTLADLCEISEWFSRLQSDESGATSDPTFSSAFPSSFRDCLRHRSGNEVLLHRDQDGRIVSHRVDAPNPADELFAAWIESLKRRLPKSRADKSMRWKRWRLAKMLGSISETRKPEVFNWVSDAMWKIEEYHSTHGRQPLSRPLEYYFDDCVIFANDAHEFELIRM